MLVANSGGDVLRRGVGMKIVILKKVRGVWFIGVGMVGVVHFFVEKSLVCHLKSTACGCNIVPGELLVVWSRDDVS